MRSFFDPPLPQAGRCPWCEVSLDGDTYQTRWAAWEKHSKQCARRADAAKQVPHPDGDEQSVTAATTSSLPTYCVAAWVAARRARRPLRWSA